MDTQAPTENPIPDLVTPWGVIQAPVDAGDTARDRLRDLLAFRSGPLSITNLDEAWHTWQADLWRAELLRLRPRVKLPDVEPRLLHERVRRLDTDRWRTMTDEIQAIGEDLGRRLTETRETLDEEIDRVAADVEILPGENWHLFSSHWKSTYASSDIGTGKYAECLAQIDVASLVHLGIGTRIERTDRGSDVLVQVSEPLDVEVARRRARMPLREFVRLCWSMSCQPRVFDPFLPHGYEEREGLDFFGRDLRT